MWRVGEHCALEVTDVCCTMIWTHSNPATYALREVLLFSGDNVLHLALALCMVHGSQQSPATAPDLQPWTASASAATARRERGLATMLCRAPQPVERACQADLPATFYCSGTSCCTRPHLHVLPAGHPVWLCCTCLALLLTILGSIWRAGLHRWWGWHVAD